MREIALYYPYFHVRDDAWLKAAALYWPRLARLAPQGWPRNDSRTARVLREELGFLIEVDPARAVAVRTVAREFCELIERQHDALRERYGMPRWASDRGDAEYRSGQDVRNPFFDDGFPISRVHADKLTRLLVRELMAADLAVGRPGDEWIWMHPRLATVYVTAVADRIAEANEMQMVTDQPEAHGLVNGWTTDALAHALLDTGNDDEPVSPAWSEVAEAYAVVAIRTIVPAGLAEVPVERIVKARRVLAAEFYAFREHLNVLTDQFAKLASIEDRSILEARLELLVDQELRLPTADLDRGLRQLGLEPAQAVLSKSLDLTGFSQVVASGMPLGAAKAGPQIAAQLVASSIAAHRIAQERRRSAAGYLLGLREQLSPRGVLDHVRRTLRRASRLHV